jgi:hypothetical protein
MTTPDNQTTLRCYWQAGDPLVAAAAGRLWSIEAIFPGEPDWSRRAIEADEAQPWTDGVLFLFDHGEKAGSRRTVLTLAPGRWRSCAQVR